MEKHECVCAVDYYQTVAGNETAAPVCTTCPPGSTQTVRQTVVHVVSIIKCSFPFLDTLVSAIYS